MFNHFLLWLLKLQVFFLLSVAIEWVSLLFCIWEVLYSNLGPDIGCPDFGFLWFSSVPVGGCQHISQL
jgi:hypothetical protein